MKVLKIFIVTCLVVAGFWATLGWLHNLDRVDRLTAERDALQVERDSLEIIGRGRTIYYIIPSDISADIPDIDFWIIPCSDGTIRRFYIPLLRKSIDFESWIRSDHYPDIPDSLNHLGEILYKETK